MYEELCQPDEICFKDSRLRYWSCFWLEKYVLISFPKRLYEKNRYIFTVP